MYPCPHCNQPGISLRRRASLGPAIPATCRACGKKVRVPWGRSLLAMLPFFVAVLVVPFLNSLTLQVVVVLAGGIIMFWLYLRWVPLLKA
jgi:hypothetical protein